MSTGGGILSDSHTWVLFSAIIFGIVAFKIGKKPILGILDSHTDRIRNDLEEADRLRLEAEALLEEYTEKHKAAIDEANKIIEDAKHYADILQTNADEELARKIERQEEVLINRISVAEKQAINEIRNQAVDIATKAAEIIIKENISDNEAKLVDDTIIDLKKVI